MTDARCQSVSLWQPDGTEVLMQQTPSGQVQFFERRELLVCNLTAGVGKYLNLIGRPVSGF